jgi:hypothetical protein
LAAEAVGEDGEAEEGYYVGVMIMGASVLLIFCLLACLIACVLGDGFRVDMKVVIVTDARCRVWKRVMWVDEFVKLPRGIPRGPYMPGTLPEYAYTVQCLLDNHDLRY